MSAKKHFTAEEAKAVGEKLGIDWSKFDVEQFRMGMDVELEHGKVDAETNVTNDDPLITGKIALAHLNEFPDYYDRLYELEEEAEEFWRKVEAEKNQKLELVPTPKLEELRLEILSNAKRRQK